MPKKRYPGTLIAKEPDGSDWPKPESGSHNAICIKLIDLGTQTSNYKGKKFVRRRFRVVWELYETAFQLNENTEMQPFTIDKEYTLSLYHSASLRKDLDRWRGVKFTSDELTGFEVNSILGKACQLNVVIQTSERGSEYAKVENVIHMKAAEAKKVPSPYNKIEMFSFEDEEPNWEMFDSLPEYLQDIINASPEMQELREGKDANIPVSEPETNSEESDDVPF